MDAASNLDVVELRDLVDSLERRSTEDGQRRTDCLTIDYFTYYDEPLPNPMPTITLTRDDDWFVITDEETGVTTQGESKIQALLMLADALAAHDDTAVDLFTLAEAIFVPDPSSHANLRQLDENTDSLDVVVNPSVAGRFDEIAVEVTGIADPSAAVEALRERIAEYADAGKPWLRPPLTNEQIERIDDDRVRALAWDLGAIARAYNYATDPTLPDLARAEPAPWISPEELLRLERAAALLFDVYERLLDRLDEDLASHPADGDPTNR